MKSVFVSGIAVDTKHMHMAMKLQHLSTTAEYIHCLGVLMIVFPQKDGWRNPPNCNEKKQRIRK